MCDTAPSARQNGRKVPVVEAIGTVLAHDITEIRPGEFKGPAFRKGHVIRHEDVCHLQRIGKEHLFVLDIRDDELHEDDAAVALAKALMGEGVAARGEPREGKMDIVAERDGILKVDAEALLQFNMLGDVMCSTLHANTLVTKGRTVAATRAIPLVVGRQIVEEAVRIASSGRPATGLQPERAGSGVVSVLELSRPHAGIVITGNEVYYGRVQDAFTPIITAKIREFGGEVVDVCFAPDDTTIIEDRLRTLIAAGADLLITTGGMSVDPDDVTRFAIRNLGTAEFTYGSAVLPGAMFLIAYLETENAASIPVLGIPACGMYARTTVFDLILPRVLAGERIGRRQLAELGHGGLCMKCEVCRYPVCPFGK